MERIRASSERTALRRGDRLVQRYRTAGLALTWSPLTRGILRSRHKDVPVQVLNLSVSGALLLAPANPLVRRGTVVAVESGHGRGTVEVRHVHDHPDGERQYFGVLFLEMEEPLREWVFARIARLRGDDGELEGEWNHAT